MTNYAELRTLGIQTLERLNGGTWTDFNAHDPGITMLEALCYALTDLEYRTEHDIPDLLADGGSDPHASLHDPASLLSTRAVTVNDLRRLVLDVVGVKNVWIEYVEERLPPNDVPLAGIYRVLLEVSEEREGLDVRREVGKRLHNHRGLCEDFTDIVVMDSFRIAVDADIEIGRVDDPNITYAAILDAIGEIISPTIRMSTLAQRQSQGSPVDEIFDGPLLDHGFILDKALAEPRVRAIHVSDIIHAVMDVPGVRAVTQVSLNAGDLRDTWSLMVPQDRAPRLDRSQSKVQLLNGGLPVAIGQTPSAPPFPVRQRIGPHGGLTLPTGRNRNVGRYHSVQNDLPMLYGVGEAGLSDAEPTERKALAKQLKAYLMFFDQLLANQLAQLAQVKDLFSMHPVSSERTYFTQVLNEPTLGLQSIASATQEKLDDMAERSADAWARKDRFLNHLLARLGENLNDRYAAAFRDDATVESTMIRQKQEFLEQYPRIGGSRGTAFDGLGSLGKTNTSGLEDRIRFKLGLDESQGERMAMVEHVLLRPGQLHRFDWFLDRLPTQAQVRDPYSLRISFVFPNGAGRFANPAFRSVVEQTVRSQTPAHIGAYVHWLDDATWATFQPAHKEWRRVRREHLASKLGISLGLDARLLTYVSNLPVLPGVSEATASAARVADHGAKALVNVDGTQEGNAGYSLIRESDGEFFSITSVLGTGKTIAVESVELTEDLVLRVQVDRIFDDTILLDTALPVKVRANPGLEVKPDESAQIAPNALMLLTISGSQASVTYHAFKRSLVDEDFSWNERSGDLHVNVAAIAGCTQASTVYVRPPPDKAWTSAEYLASGTAKQGNGGTLALEAGPMQEDCIVIVRAHKDHGAIPADATDVQMAQAVLLLKRPDTAPNLTLTKTSNTTIALTGGEPGVFYYLLDPGTNALLGKPGYFQRMRDATINRGIGGMRIGHDLVVARGIVAADADRATTAPLNPVVTVAAIPASNTVKLMAVRGRTGATWKEVVTMSVVV